MSQRQRGSSRGGPAAARRTAAPTTDRPLPARRAPRRVALAVLHLPRRRGVSSSRHPPCDRPWHPPGPAVSAGWHLQLYRTRGHVPVMPTGEAFHSNGARNVAGMHKREVLVCGPATRQAHRWIDHGPGPPARRRREVRTVMQKYVYEFSEGGKDQKDLLGGKGANLAEMTRLGLPVPPGFTITTEACREYLRIGRFPVGLLEEVET